MRWDAGSLMWIVVPDIQVAMYGWEIFQSRAVQGWVGEVGLEGKWWG